MDAALLRAFAAFAGAGVIVLYSNHKSPNRFDSPS
jgi:hypothetical protein